MLTVREIRTDDRRWAIRAAEVPLVDSLSPRAFQRAEEPPDNRANAMWLGATQALRRFGLEPGTETIAEKLASALQGRHVITGEQVRQQERAPSSADLILWAPMSVSWVWSQAGAQTRAEIEQLMVQAANRTLGYLAQTRPVVANKEPAVGFAASVALHVTVPDVPGKPVPPPLLHVHCYLVGVLDTLGQLSAPVLDSLDEDSAMRELGAYGRAVLAEGLRELGFRIRAGTGPGRRYFEIDGVPQGLLEQADLFDYARCVAEA